MESPERDRIALVCEDAGPAAAWSPVVRELERRGHSLTVWATGRAEETFARTNIPVKHFQESWLDMRPTVVITGTAGWGERIDARAIRAARDAGIPTLSYVDFWWRYAERFTHEAPLDSLPDVIAVIDERMREGVAEAGIHDHLVVTTGSPLLDEACNFALLPPRHDAPLLFLSQPIEALYGPVGDAAHAMGYTERDALPIVAGVATDFGLELRIRPHPREDAASLRGFVATLAAATVFSEDRTLEEDVEESRGVIGLTTMALAEAALMGRPTLSVQLSPHTFVLPTFEAGLTVLAQDRSAVAGWVSSLLEGRLARSTRYDASGSAVKRLADAVEHLLATRGVQSGPLYTPCPLK
jgi:hypothetical protein